MILRKSRFWLGILIVSLLCLGYQFFRPTYHKKFQLKYSSPQTIDLGEIPAATYSLSAVYVWEGYFMGGPDSKIEVLDRAGTRIYTNIHKNDDFQIIPEFKISERQSLTAEVELIDSNPVGFSRLELYLRHQDEPIHFRIFWSGVLGLFLSTIALSYLRRWRSKSHP